MIERLQIAWHVAWTVIWSAGPNRAATVVGLLGWGFRGEPMSKLDMSAEEQLEHATKRVRAAKRAKWIGGAVGLLLVAWLVANPLLRFCRDRWPRGTSEATHGIWALVTSPGFGAVGAVIAALVAFRGALRSQARSASKDRWWATFEWVMKNRADADGTGSEAGFDPDAIAEWFGYLKGTATSPDESVIMNVLTQEAIRRGEYEL